MMKTIKMMIAPKMMMEAGTEEKGLNHTAGIVFPCQKKLL